jgi:flagellar hook-basal body complex protein FliE
VAAWTSEMAISPVGAAASLAFDLLGKAGGVGGGNPGTGSTGGVAGIGGGTTASSFANTIGDAVTHLNNLHNTADGLANQAVTGQLTNVEDYLTKATEAQLTTQLTVAVRNKAVEAYQEIMRMAV